METVKRSASDFLGAKVLTPLEENVVLGGTAPTENHDTQQGAHHDESHHHNILEEGI